MRRVGGGSQRSRGEHGALGDTCRAGGADGDPATVGKDTAVDLLGIGHDLGCGAARLGGVSGVTGVGEQQWSDTGGGVAESVQHSRIRGGIGRDGEGGAAHELNLAPILVI